MKVGISHHILTKQKQNRLKFNKVLLKAVNTFECANIFTVKLHKGNKQYRLMVLEEEGGTDVN